MVRVILRRRDVEKATGLSRSTIYSLISSGQFPRPVRLSARAVGWLEDDIKRWQESRSVTSG